MKCCDSIEIVNFTGTEKNDDISLKGQCTKCGHEVGRVIETSVKNWKKN